MSTANTNQISSPLLRFAVDKLGLEVDAVPGAYARLSEAASLVTAVASLSSKVAPCCQWVFAAASVGLSFLGGAFFGKHGHEWLELKNLPQQQQRPLSGLGKVAVGNGLWPEVDAQTNVTAFANVIGTILSVISRMNALANTKKAKLLSSTASAFYGVMGAFQTKVCDLLRITPTVMSADVGARSGMATAVA